MVIATAGWSVSNVSQMLCRIAGYARGEATRLDLMTFLGGVRAQGTYEAIASTTRWGDTWQGEFKAEQPRGEGSWAPALVSPIRSDSGEVVQYLTTLNVFTESQQLLDRLQGLPFYDSLTQLPNRARIDELSDPGYAVLFLDFDRFKLINDRLGDEMGDTLVLNQGKRSVRVGAAQPRGPTFRLSERLSAPTA